MKDYKGVSFSFKARKLGRRRRFLLYLIIFALVAGGVTVYRFISEGNSIDEYQQKLAGHSKKEKMNPPPVGIFFRDTEKELKALYYLDKGMDQQAQNLLNTLQTYSGRIDHKAILNGFVDRGRYSGIIVYSDFLLGYGVDANYFRALGATAFLDSKKSIKHLAAIGEDIRKAEAKAIKKLEKINRQIDSGFVDFVFDRNGKAIGAFKVKNESVRSSIRGMELNGFRGAMKSGLSHYKLTLDKDIQEIVHKSFSGFKGSFVLLDLRDNGVLAAYSKPLGEDGNTVFTKKYLPASVVKLITAFSWMHSNKRRDSFFPFKCLGNMRVDGKTFYDWSRHDQLNSVMDAMAVSCNMVFAKFGLEMKYPYFSEQLKRFGFNKAPVSDGFVKMDFGEISMPENDYDLGKMSIGLKNIKMTTIHGAYIAALIAREGACSDPYLIRNVTNLIGIGVAENAPEEKVIIKDNRSLGVVKESMLAVMNAKNGTGRRGNVEGMKVAAKTGTAGERRPGFHAMMIGFFPADKPLYGFALRLEHGGKADKAGTKVLKRFLTGVRSRLRK